ncbi:TBC1 domain family member 20-like isoform X2 [Antechinus flavipes]|uniref:TBC1 domain family member 20-like isoform X2 n=1 Tax=Antechinus flavipes TaxID=38775 RepID=UPI002235B15D|nr:TBC1 domain family member 20-like isoform X2 [Antechinus flavipes]
MRRARRTGDRRGGQDRDGTRAKAGEEKLTSQQTRGLKNKPNSESWRRQKLLQIHEALSQDPVDVELLRKAAQSRGGLLSDQVRRKVWPRLLGLSPYDLPRHPGRSSLQDHRDYHQVQMDVERSLAHFPRGMRPEQRAVLQEQLVAVILAVLSSRPELHYYQGYHEVALALLLVLGPRAAAALLDQLSMHHLRDFMDPTMDNTWHILNYLLPLLARESPQLHSFMESWLLTWFGHVLPEPTHVLRLMDFFLASHPLMPVYVAAAVVLYREPEVLACPCDMPSLHQLLSRLPQPLPTESLLAQALNLFARHPHSQLAQETAMRTHSSLSIEGSFTALRAASAHQRPDWVLQKQRQQPGYQKASGSQAGPSTLVKAAVWGLSATLGAAALAVTQTALGWGPEVLWKIF